MSHEPCSRSAVKACWFPPISSSAIRRVSSGPSGGNPVILTGTNWPLTSMCGRLPGEKIKSLTRAEARNIADSNFAAGIAGLTVVGPGTEILAGISRIFSLLSLQLILRVEEAQVTKVVVPMRESIVHRSLRGQRQVQDLISDKCA